MNGLISEREKSKSVVPKETNTQTSVKSGKKKGRGVKVLRTRNLRAQKQELDVQVPVNDKERVLGNME